MRTIILAAGQGKRLGSDIPKCLLKVGDETILSKLITQLKHFDVTDISVVVGFGKEHIITELEKISGIDLNIIHNDRYREDTNILSLFEAISTDVSPFIVIESDVILGDKSIEQIYSMGSDNRSYWFTMNKFQKEQVGGILQTDEGGEVIDLRIVHEYTQEFEDYRKLIGILMVGPNELATYFDLLRKYSSESTLQYYLNPWIENLNLLPCRECKLDGQKAISFNTKDEYAKALNMFDHPED